GTPSVDGNRIMTDRDGAFFPHVVQVASAGATPHQHARGVDDGQRGPHHLSQAGDRLVDPRMQVEPKPADGSEPTFHTDRGARQRVVLYHRDIDDLVRPHVRLEDLPRPPPRQQGVDVFGFSGCDHRGTGLECRLPDPRLRERSLDVLYGAVGDDHLLRPCLAASANYLGDDGWVRGDREVFAEIEADVRLYD